jgi:hypothetical protein
MQAAVFERERNASRPNLLGPALSTGDRSRSKDVNIGNGFWGEGGEVGRKKVFFAESLFLCRYLLQGCLCLGCCYILFEVFGPLWAIWEVEGHCDGRLG